MEKRLRTFFYLSLFLIFTLLIEKSNAKSPENELNEDFKSLVFKEIGLLKKENQNQNIEIERMKKFVGIKGNNNHEDAKLLTSHSLETNQERYKRPYRLLPRIDNINNGPRLIFYGPPTNCSDLSQLGYTLNGYYLVKSSIPEITQVETVYCSFKQPGGVFNPSGSEQKVSSPLTHPKIGSVGTGVHFYVLLQKFTDIEPNAIIKFDDIKLNMGNGYNSNAGIFTAPKSGVYRFFFTANILGEQRGGMAALYQNGRIVGVAAKYPLGDTVPDRDPIIQAILEVKRGETITVKSALRKELPGGRKLSYFNLLSFTGSLLEEYNN